jgi:hypothetical protein
VYPPSDTAIRDRSGKERKVGKEQYKNRLLAFIESKQSGSSAAVLTAELSHLADRLDAFYEKSCKGVHADVTAGEVRITLLSAYMFLAELVRLADADAAIANSAAQTPAAPQASPAA